jgi:hypothetical protein
VGVVGANFSSSAGDEAHAAVDEHANEKGTDQRGREGTSTFEEQETIK